MDRYLKKFKATDYDHCIIKEELIISDDEQDDSVHVKIEPIVESFVDPDVKKAKSNGQTKRKSGCLGLQIVNVHNDKQSALESILKSENTENNEQLKNSNNVAIDKKLKATSKAAFTSGNIDALYKKLTKSYCLKCKVKRAVVRRKARCLVCNSQLTYSCEACNKTFRDFTNLGYHLQSQHTDNPQTHPCPVCNKIFVHRSRMQEHQRTHYNFHMPRTGERRCAKCGKKFESKHIREHEKICDAEPPLKCDKCPYATAYQSNLRKHVYNKHMDFKKECENCNKTFTNRKSMRTHLRVYCNKVKRFECHHCGHKVYRRDQMMNHLDQAHFGGSLTGKLVNDSRIPRICKFCDKSLEPFERIKYHLRGCVSAPLEFRRPSSPVDGNNDKSDRSCKYCGLRLKRYEHMRYHLDRCESAPSDCRLESETADQSDLDAAVKNLSKAYCENCKIKRPLKLEKRRCKKCDTLLKYTCERCAKTFAYEKLLLDHFRVKHVKNKKFHQCDKCSRSYSHLKYLKLHKKTHHPSKPTAKIHECSKCERNYENVESLRKHSVYCGKEPKLCCDKCPYKTHFKSSLIDHFRAKKSTCM